MLGVFATAINCMDGRVQLPVIHYVKSVFGVDYVDSITIPAPNRILADGEDLHAISAIKRCVELSVKTHGSRLVAITAHHDCAGNPANKKKQLEQLSSAIEAVKSWNFDVMTIGLWIDENWKAHRVE